MASHARQGPAAAVGTTCGCPGGCDCQPKTDYARTEGPRAGAPVLGCSLSLRRRDSVASRNDLRDPRHAYIHLFLFQSAAILGWASGTTVAATTVAAKRRPTSVVALSCCSIAEESPEIVSPLQGEAHSDFAVEGTGKKAVPLVLAGSPAHLI